MRSRLTALQTRYSTQMEEAGATFGTPRRLTSYFDPAQLQKKKCQRNQLYKSISWFRCNYNLIPSISKHAYLFNQFSTIHPIFFEFFVIDFDPFLSLDSIGQGEECPFTQSPPDEEVQMRIKWGAHIVRSEVELGLIATQPWWNWTMTMFLNNKCKCCNRLLRSSRVGFRHIRRHVPRHNLQSRQTKVKHDVFGGVQMDTIFLIFLWSLLAHWSFVESTISWCSWSAISSILAVYPTDRKSSNNRFFPITDRKRLFLLTGSI